MAQEFNGDIKGQFAGNNIINHNYAPEADIPWYQQPDEVLQQMVKFEKKKRFNAIKRKFFNIPSVILFSMLITMLSFLYPIISNIVLYKDFTGIQYFGAFIQQYNTYVIAFVVVSGVVVVWLASKTRLEHRIIQQSNANIDEIKTVLKSRH